MASLTIALPPQSEQTSFNLHRWAEVLADPEVARIEARIETDRYGHVIVSPPPAPNHGSLQARISSLLDHLMTTGRVLSECPISTADGVRAADVAWASPARMGELGNLPCFPKAPEICVEVLSPGNSQLEMTEKAALYFDAGAQEVWLCSESGQMTFFVSGMLPIPASRLVRNSRKRSLCDKRRGRICLHAVRHSDNPTALRSLRPANLVSRSRMVRLRGAPSASPVGWL
ncbi:MAG: hypothetical protein JWM16_5962 [Verrucomicrobiales bacterium]|nr:hypothetical protein [Verrucomicrobiales bacterium]